MSDKQHIMLRIRLFGAFHASDAAGAQLRITSTKQCAMLALLATAPNGKRTRPWLQDTLWSLSGPDLGRASLRRALSDLRQRLGGIFAEVFEVSNDAIRLRLDRIEVIGTPADGAFLEGIDIPEEGFEDWLTQQRQAATAGLPRRHAPQGIALNLQDRLRPSVAILPFVVAQTGDVDGFLGDMVAEEATRALSRVKSFDVISHLSCRNVDSRNVGMAELRQSLDLDYVVCGSLRQTNDRFRVDADFVDTSSGRLRWSQTFHGQKTAFFEGEQELINELAGSVARSIFETSVELAASRPLPDVQSHALLISSIALMHRQDLASFARARMQIEELIRRVPDNAILHSWLGKWYVLCVAQGWSTHITADSQKARECTDRALSLNPGCAFSLAINGFVQSNLLKRFDTALDRFDQVISVDQSNAMAWLLKGMLHAFMDQGERAVEYTDRARFLSPLDPSGYLFDTLSATARLSHKDYDGALRLADRSLSANKNHTSTLRVRTIALHGLDRMDEARGAAQELLRREPNLTIKTYLKKHAAAEFSTGQAWASALRDCGVPDS